MRERELIGTLAEHAGAVPAHAEVLALRQHTLDELHRRVHRLLTAVGEVCGARYDRGDWQVQHDRTVVRLPDGARAVTHHASGALRYVAGRRPMDALFPAAAAHESLTAMVEEAARAVRVRDWIGETERLSFERLWRVRAAGSTQNGRATEPVLCRVVGAYRHAVGGLPVWGAASVAVTLAGGGLLDALDVQVRQPTGEVIDRAPVLKPEHAARHLLLQLHTLLRGSSVPPAELAHPEWMRFGYLALSRRQRQTMLAPAYVALIRMRGEAESHGYLLVAPATERPYLALTPPQHAPTPPFRRADEPSRAYELAPTVRPVRAAQQT